VRLNPETGTVRVLDDPGAAVARGAASSRVRAALIDRAAALGLEPRDLATLTLQRDYVSRSTGVRHVVFAQRVRGLPVFDSAIAVHLRPDGTVARITSNAAPEDGRREAITFSAADAIQAAIRARESNPSLFRMLPTWVVTVRSEMNRRAPISLLARPSAISLATSTSRFESGPVSTRSSASTSTSVGSPSASRKTASRSRRAPTVYSASNLAAPIAAMARCSD